jgi:hypothetical protein
MAIPATPSNFLVQSGNGNAFLSWDQSSGSTSYLIQRSADNITFSALATVSGSPLANTYLDSTGTSATQYYYQVAAHNTDGTSSYTTPVAIIVEPIGVISLGALRLQAQQRCDRVNSTFVTTTEWNSYISASYKELYDILIQKFAAEYFLQVPYTYTLATNVQYYPLPADFYKMFLVEVALNPQDPNSYVTLRKFQKIQQNLWNYPNIYTFYGITNIRYRVEGNQLHLVPAPTGGQTLRINYAPRPNTLMADTDSVDGVSGWEEYIVVDACLKALAKEESDVSVYMAQKAALLQRINEAAENRDIGEPETVSDSRMRNFSWSDSSEGNYGGSGSGW